MSFNRVLVSGAVSGQFSLNSLLFATPAELARFYSHLSADTTGMLNRHMCLPLSLRALRSVHMGVIPARPAHTDASPHASVLRGVRHLRHSFPAGALTSGPESPLQSMLLRLLSVHQEARAQQMNDGHGETLVYQPTHEAVEVLMKFDVDISMGDTLKALEHDAAHDLVASAIARLSNTARALAVNMAIARNYIGEFRDISTRGGTGRAPNPSGTRPPVR